MISFFALYVFSTPYFSDRRPFNYLVYLIFALFTVFVFLHRFLYYDIKKINIRIFFLPSFAIFSVIGTVVFSHQFRVLLTVFLLSISYIVIYFMLEQVNNNDLIIKITIFALTLFVLFFIVHYRTEIFDFKHIGSNRLALDNYFDNVNTVAYYIAGCCIFSFYYALFGKKPIYYLFLIVFFLCFFVGIMTASRSFIVGVVLSVIIILFIKFRKKPLILIPIVVFLVICIIFAFTLPVFSPLKKRMIDMFNMITGRAYSTDYSTATRLLWQDYAFYLGGKNLFFGLGLDGFSIYSGTGTYSHANIAELVCDTGIIGSLLYYLVFVVAIYDVIRKNMKYKPLVIMLLCFLIAREFLGVAYTSKFNAFVFALISYSGSLGLYKEEANAIIKKEDYLVLEI